MAQCTRIPAETQIGFFNRIFGGSPASDQPPSLQQQIEKAVNGLAIVTATHSETWHIGDGNWSLDQNVGDLIFDMPNGTRAVASAQIIGTYSTTGRTWLWAWDHPSILPPLTQHAKQMLAYGKKHGYDRLTNRKLQCSEEEAWELTALAFLVCEANGAYRGPAGTARVFMTFGEVELSKPR